jgi:hypothetical protein
MAVMNETRQLCGLISDIHNAAVDSTLWVDVPAAARSFIDRAAASLAWEDAGARHGDGCYDDGITDPS